MVTRGETLDGEVRYFVRDEHGEKLVTVIIHARVNEESLAGHLYQFDDDRAAQTGGGGLTLVR
jgi:hypothetical protein